jgi:glycine/D-amino acid oxidase-like deaminating enzyme
MFDLSNVRNTPFWWEEAPRPEPVATPLPKETDIAVIGSGFTGLSAALTAARAGREVTVFEADLPGFGASSRNGGGVGATPFKIKYSEAEASLGKEGAIRLYREGLASVAYLEELIEREQIRCHYTRSGRYVGIHRASAEAALRKEVGLLQDRLGLEVEMVERKDQREHIGSDFYLGGRFSHRDGVVHPGLLHQGLLERAQAAGVRVLGKTPVTEVKRAGSALTLSTPRGQVKARKLVVGTNGYTGGAIPWLERRFIPVTSNIIATEELDPALVKRLVPRNNMIVDTKRTVHYYRASPDGRRILMGGRPAMRDAHWSVSAKMLYGFMLNVWPELEGTNITHAWGGRLGFTFDRLPHIGEHDGVHYAGGYLGSGVAMSNYLGHKLALQAIGDPAGETALDNRAFPTMPFYSGNPWFLTAVAAYYRFRDSYG